MMKAGSGSGGVFGGAFLIAGTTVGVGMLALPIATGPAGFIPSISIYLACWLFMLCTGLLMLEVCSWMPPESNLISMASKFLGPVGKAVCWFTYLLLFELVMTAHITGGGGILNEIFGKQMSVWAASVVYTIVFSPVVYLGTRVVDRINVLMFSGVLISYFLFIFVAAGSVDVELLKVRDWGKAALAIPILFAAFTYQVILPTLVTYMKSDYKKVRKSILFGTSIPLVVYVIWQILILGIVPIEGVNGLIEAGVRGDNAVTPLKHFVGSKWIIGIGRSFAFFTMTASYIALALAFLDFLSDGLKVKKVGMRKAILCLAIFIPPLIVSLFKPDAFISSLELAGGVSIAILFGLFPPLMVWVGRYKMRKTTGQQIPGGRIFLSILILFIVCELWLALFN